MQPIDKTIFQVNLCYLTDKVANTRVNIFLMIKIRLKLISLLN